MGVLETTLQVKVFFYLFFLSLKLTKTAIFSIIINNTFNVIQKSYADFLL